MSRLAPIALLVVAALPLHGAGTVRVVTKDGAGAPVADAVAALRPAGSAAAVPPPSDPVAIVQKDQEFVPYVTAIVVGTRIIFPNRDNVQHHIYSVSPAKRFEIPLYIGESTNSIPFDRPGIVVLGCNIHDWMVAYVDVLDTPYFARTGADGRAEVAGLPAGRYTLEVWHPRAAKVDREVEVSDGSDQTQAVAVVLKPGHRIRRTPDGGGAQYK